MGEASRFPVTSSVICISFEVQAPRRKNQFYSSRWAAASASAWTGATEKEDAGLQVVLQQRIATKLREGRHIPRCIWQRPGRKEGATGWASYGANCYCQRFHQRPGFISFIIIFWRGRWKWSLKALEVSEGTRGGVTLANEGGRGWAARRGLAMLHVFAMFDS